MKRIHFLQVLVCGLSIFLLEGCVHRPMKTVKEEPPPQSPSTLPQQTVLLQEARTEAEQLRSEVASLKILMAKQSGELRTLQQQTQGVHAREQEQGQQLQTIRADLLASQAERDQLRRRNVELEGQVGSLANANQLVSEIQALRTSFQHVMANIKSLAADLVLIKQEMHIAPQKATLQHTTLKESGLPHSGAPKQTPDAKGRIVIQEGDTLWKLSNRYGVSLEQLREWNHLSSDLIMTGLRLRVVSPEKAALPAQNLAAEPAAPPVVSPPAEGARNTPDTGIKAPTPKKPSAQSDTKNLLSISASER